MCSFNSPRDWNWKCPKEELMGVIAVSCKLTHYITSSDKWPHSELGWCMWLAFDPKVEGVFSLRKRKTNELVKLFACNIKMNAENQSAGYLIEEYAQNLDFNSAHFLCVRQDQA